jgi:hypothetical protein
MKKLLIGVLFLATVSNLMAERGDLKQKDLDYRVIENNRAVSVAYFGPNYLKKFEEDKADVEMRKPRELYHSAEIAIRVSASRMYDANPFKWLFIILDGNKQEIYRSRGSRKAPSRSDGIWRTTWAAYHYILITDDPVYPLYLRIVGPDGEPIDVIIEKK